MILPFFGITPMINNNQHRHFIVIFLALLASVVFLAWTQYRQQYAPNQSWWAIAFASPEPTTADHTLLIENHTDDPHFSITTTCGTTQQTKHLIVADQTQKRFTPPCTQKKITMSVEHGDESRILYK